MRHILVTGTSSGLGRYLHTSINGSSLDRSTTPQEVRLLRQEGVETIVHCAYNPVKSVPHEKIDAYMQDTVFLTRDLLAIPHQKFVFISTVDVYQNSDKKHSESERLNLEKANGIYATTKMMCESMVLKDKDSLVLRCSALLGPTMRKNSLTRILSGEDCTLTLSADSQFNYVLYSNVKDIVDLAKKQGLNGIYNVASSQNVTLSRIADKFGKRVKFGDFVYNPGKIDNSKVCQVYPKLDVTSEDIVDQFLLP